MTKVRGTVTLALLALALVGAVGVAGAQDRDQRTGRAVAHAPAGRQVFDSRYGHARYYPARGAVVSVLPGGYRSYYFHGQPFFFVGGVWYVTGPGGFIVAAPPYGLVLTVLPPFYTTVWLGGVPYYYADDVYYQWDPGANGYQVVAPPPGADQPGPPAAAPPPAPSAEGELYIYPKNGQTPEQQAQDRYECHSWATGQTGFDPTQPGGGVPPDQNGPKSTQYRRAMTACLDARGYSVD